MLKLWKLDIFVFFKALVESRRIRKEIPIKICFLTLLV